MICEREREVKLNEWIQKDRKAVRESGEEVNIHRKERKEWG